MLGLMLAALGGTAVARLGADAAERRRERRAPAHEAGADPAQRAAVAASPDAASHGRLAGAGVSTALARLGAADACFNASLKDFIGFHEVLLFRVRAASGFTTSRCNERLSDKP